MTLVEPSWDAARAQASALFSAGSVQELKIAECADRVLAVDAPSLVPLPTYETSAMDGYVVAGEAPWKIVGEAKAGALFHGELRSGEALQIATGAVIPKGAFGVLRWEDAIVDGDFVSGKTSFRKDFRPAGQEAALNEILVKAGSRLSPGMIGLLSAAGYDTLKVYAKPKVALILLGDEIQLSGLPTNGLVRDSLGPQIPIWFERLGCEVAHIEFVPDKFDLTVNAIESAINKYDIVATTGGTADGPRDFLHDAIDKLGGKIVVDKVAVRPGHPQLLATIQGKALLGLPGNPQSAVVALMTLGLPLINSMLGISTPDLPEVSTNDVFEAQPGFTRLVLGTLNGDHFQISEYLGSAMLRGLAHSDGFAVVTNPPTNIRWLGLPV